MAIDLTFKQVSEYIKKDQPELIDAVDKLLGMSLICSPIVFGPIALPILTLLTAKNELVRIGKSVFDAVVGKKDNDFLAHHERMQKAYGLICFTSFFEALGETLPEVMRKQLELLSAEKEFISKKALQAAKRNKEQRNPEGDEVTVDITSVSVPFPHPLEGFIDQETRLRALYSQLTSGFLEFTKCLAFWDKMTEKDHAILEELPKKLPDSALQSFRAQYFMLAQKYPDFGIWANLHEHEKTAKLLKGLSGYVHQYSELTKTDRSAMDIGFAKLHDAIAAIPEVLQSARATEVVQGLQRHYEARVADPIIEDKYEPVENQPQLTFPSIRDAFIPQSYRALRQTTKSRRLEAEETWTGAPVRQDLGAFILSYLSSPYSIKTPLVILGHPGSGKSLLTKVLSAILLSPHYTPIRVPLREVDSDALIQNQIEQAIHTLTGYHIDGWAHFSSRFKNNPPVVILDGYDELLQASGRVFSNYLTGVQNFQQQETEQSRPVRVLVTSRLTLIDKATIPVGATIVRLMEFDKRQRNKWISIWNNANRNYFKRSEPQVHPFALPSENDPDGKNVLALSEQPLLLLMLAIYDSEKNRLRKSKSLDRTFLYDSLLRRFVERERKKDPEFQELKEKDRQEQVDRDMQRLGVAAIGMYNRRKLHILSQELNGDLGFFDLERKPTTGNGRQLSQADMLLGSFFFVHKSKAKQKGEAPDQYEESSAFEFLHNTFGEFLTADFILRQAVGETESLAALSANENLRNDRQRKLEAADGFSQAWFASMIYTPLFSRPVVLEMIREWTDHCLKRRKRSRNEFLTHLDELILNQIRRLLCHREMPSIMQGKPNAPFGHHPLLGHVAIYSMNLIILRAILTEEGFVFAEDSIGSHEDGSRPWDQLTHVWRSWFALDNLNGITAILEATRERTSIRVRSKKTFGVSTSNSRLETVLNVGIALGDNVTSGLAGLVSYNPHADNRLSLSAVAERLKDESIDLRLQMLVKELLGPREMVARGGIEELRKKAEEAMRLAIGVGRWNQFRAVVGALMRERGVLEGLFHDLFHPARNLDVFHQRPEAFVEALKVAREAGTWHWLRRWGAELFERFFHRGGWPEMLDRFPEHGAELVLASQEWGGRIWPRDFPRGFPEEMLEGLFRGGRQGGGQLWRKDAEGSDLRWGTEAAAASILLALERGSPEFLEKLRGERLRDVLGAEAMVRMIKEWPGATVELCILANSPRSPQWLQELSEEWFRHFLEPATMMELLNSRPEAGVQLLRLYRRKLQSTRQRRGISKGLEVGKIGDPRYVMQALHTWPEAGIELVRMLREMDPQWAGHFGEVWLGQETHPRAVMELLYEMPEIGVELLRHVRDSGSDRMEPWLREFLRPGAIKEILNRRPDVGVDLLRLLGGSQRGGFIGALGADFAEKIFNPELISDLAYRNPEALAELLRVVREIGGGERLRGVNADWLEKSFPPAETIQLMQRRPDACIGLLDLAKESGARRWLHGFTEHVAAFLTLTLEGDSFLTKIPVGLALRIKWAAQESGNEDLLEKLTRALEGGEGPDPDHGGQRLA